MSHPVTWVTAAGLLGVYPAEIPLSFKVSAIAEPPYIITDYVLISGSLPEGLSFRDDGLIYGTPNTVNADKSFTFVIRVNSTDGNSIFIKDRTFSLEISGEATPNLIPAVEVTVYDSIWQNIQITYNNPISTNPVSLRILSGNLPPGLEMNEFGLIRGYPEPPITSVNLPIIETTITAVSSLNNYVSVISTSGFSVNRPIIFSSSIANIESGKTYYIKEIININQFTITTIPNNVVFSINESISSFVDVTLPSINVGQPTKRQYTFTVDLSSPAGNDRQNYTIIVVNQNLPTSQGGPGFVPGTRVPVIYNTRPPTYNIQADASNYGYYVLPPADSVPIPGTTYLPTELANIGQFQSNNYFSFQILGHDYDGSNFSYEFKNLPNWMAYDTTTGWIYGNPVVSTGNIEQFNFSVNVYKVVGGVTISSADFNFTFQIANSIDGEIIWVSDTDLGTLFNATISYKNVEAISDVPLIYELWSGALPPNLTLNELGEIRGVVAYQTNNNFIEQYSDQIFNFIIKAYNPNILKNVDAPYLITGQRYFIEALGSTDFTEVGAEQVTASEIIGGDTYFINFIGNTDFTTIGGIKTSAGSFVDGREYIINSVGTTDFILIGALDNNVGTIFTATGPGIGSGDAYETKLLSNNPGIGTGTVIKQEFLASGSTTGTGVAQTYIVSNDKQFTLTVKQIYDIPTDNLYIKCTPSIGDRDILASLLNNNTLIPANYLYRPGDPYFGKAASITYGHAYGIYSSDLEEYILAVQKNHYWKNVTLGLLDTAVAKDETGKIIYEVVYSNVIDNLQKYDPNKGIDYRYSTSISEQIYWPRFIDLNLGPWYTSNSELYTSYIFAQDAILITQLREFNLLTQTGIPIMMNGGVPTLYTSLSPEYARILYPNSLDNMRNRVEQTLGANYNFRLLPLWMTSQQSDGNTLGYTPAWVIAYTKPAELISTTASQTYAETDLLPPRVVVESTEGFVVSRPIVFSGNTFGNIINGQVYYIKQILSATEIVLTETITYDDNDNPIPGSAYSLYNENDSFFGPMTVTFDPVSYAEIIKERIQKDWDHSLNEIDFDIDRFTVDKAITFDFDAKINTGIWLDYPSATPTPEPIDSENFYVLFPRRNILSRTESDNVIG